MSEQLYKVLDGERRPIHGGFGNWPRSAEPEAVCHLLSRDGRVVTVLPTDCCSRWESGR